MFLFNNYHLGIQGGVAFVKFLLCGMALYHDLLVYRLIQNLLEYIHSTDYWLFAVVMVVAAFSIYSVYL
jgi:hypothetical protein